MPRRETLPRLLLKRRHLLAQSPATIESDPDPLERMLKS